MSAKNNWIKIILPFLILVIGIIGMVFLVKSRQPPQKEVQKDLGTLVKVFTAHQENRQVEILATGTVQARQEASITPQVSGKVVYIAPNFASGGFFKKGELFFEIEAVDYQLAVEQAAAEKVKAELDLVTVESQAKIARIEWERLKESSSEAPNPLVLYKPQLKNARAKLASAQAALEQTRINLERTKVYAPFNCRVRSEEIDLGQYVRAGNSVGMIAGTDMAEVEIPLPLEELHWLDIPRQGRNSQGSPVTVFFQADGQDYRWQGRIERSLGEVDPRGRMLRVVALVNDPYQLKANHDKPDLVIGMFVEVKMHGTTLKDVITIPRKALRENDTVWIMDEENLLRIRKVEVVRRERESVMVKTGLKEGDRVIITALAGAADGLKLRLLGEGAVR